MGQGSRTAVARGTGLPHPAQAGPRRTGGLGVSSSKNTVTSQHHIPRFGPTTMTREAAEIVLYSDVHIALAGQVLRLPGECGA